MARCLALLQASAAAGQIAGFGVKLWPVTPKHISERLGDTEGMRTVESGPVRQV